MRFIVTFLFVLCIQFGLFMHITSNFYHKDSVFLSWDKTNHTKTGYDCSSSNWVRLDPLSAIRPTEKKDD